MTLLMRTVHGSHLYGLNHASSDVDYYEVHSDDAFKGKAKQVITNDSDIVSVSLSEFMRQCHKGVPQALEALYSPDKQVNEIQYLVDGFQHGTEVVNTFLRTIRSFTLDKRGEKDTKYRRHAVRLTLEMNSLTSQGFFNPRLTKNNAVIVRQAESMTVDEVKVLINSLSVIQVF